MHGHLFLCWDGRCQESSVSTPSMLEEPLGKNLLLFSLKVGSVLDLGRRLLRVVDISTIQKPAKPQPQQALQVNEVETLVLVREQESTRTGGGGSRLVAVGSYERSSATSARTGTPFRLYRPCSLQGSYT